MVIRQQQQLTSKAIGLGPVFSTPSPVAQNVAMGPRKRTMAAAPFCDRQSRRVPFGPETASRNGKSCSKPSLRRHGSEWAWRTRASLTDSVIDCRMRTTSGASADLAAWSRSPENRSTCPNDLKAQRLSCTQQDPGTTRTTCVSGASHPLRASRSQPVPAGNHQIPNPRRNWTQAKEEKQ